MASPRRLALAGLLPLFLWLTVAANASALGLSTGFFDDAALVSGNAAQRAHYLSVLHAEGASVVRIGVGWSGIAPASPPAGFNASNPASPGYNWTSLDRQVRLLHARGISIAVNIAVAPTWAEGAHRPRNATAGAWRPDPAALAAFAHAAALRYDGNYPDPLDPATPLPRVRYWQAWNEPNLSEFLAPQWSRTKHGFTSVAPALFRAMVNAFYTAVKGVSKSDIVVLGGTAPYGDPPGGERTQPVAFDRTLFCLRGAKALTPVSCPGGPVHFDILDHHPYGIGGPLQAAFNADDAAVPDVYKIGRVLRAAQRAGHVAPRGHKRLWVTELSWDSNPPDPNGVPVGTQARWLEQSFYVLWRQGVDTVLWYQLVDSPPVPSYAATYQGGLFYLNGKPKPATIAFEFPFVVTRRNHSHVLAWGRAPAGGRISIELLRGGRWRVLRVLHAASHGVFDATLSLTGRGVLRAQSAAGTSLSWTSSG